MTASEELAIARLLREALGYESREVRIAKLKNSPYIDVRMIVSNLERRGLLSEHSVKDTVFVRVEKA